MKHQELENADERTNAIYVRPTTTRVMFRTLRDATTTVPPRGLRSDVDTWAGGKQAACPHFSFTFNRDRAFIVREISSGRRGRKLPSRKQQEMAREQQSSTSGASHAEYIIICKAGVSW
jgi:hypothetical protein